MIDTLALANELESAGMHRGKAGAPADHLNRSLHAGLEQRLDRFESRLAGVELNFDRFVPRFAVMEQRQVTMEQRFDRLESRFANMEQRQAAVEQRLVRIEAELPFHRWAFAIVIGLQVALLLRAFWPI